MPSKLLSPRQALGDYLDEMLHQATSEEARDTLLEPRRGAILPAQLPVAQIIEEIDTLSAADAQQAEPERGRQSVEAVPSAAVSAELGFPLQCLMFRVGGHLLSVPLIQLSSVVNWSDTLTRLPQSPEWLLGLIKVRETKLRVVDSGKLLDIGATSTQSPEHLLVLGDSAWAITCDHLEQVVSLEAEDIQWKRGGDRALLLGTIRDSLSTLINPAGIAAELDSRGQGGASRG